MDWRVKFLASFGLDASEIFFSEETAYALPAYYNVCSVGRRELEYRAIDKYPSLTYYRGPDISIHVCILTRVLLEILDLVHEFFALCISSTGRDDGEKQYFAGPRASLQPSRSR